MLRSTWLTYRMHRFEVALSALLLAVFAVSVWIVSSHLTDLGIPGTCWPRDENGNFAQPVCESLMERFWDISRSEAGYARIGLALLAPIVGLILGVPVVAREIELRTTSLAWSLALRRSRWLLSRMLPMVALAVVGFVVLGWLGSGLFRAMEVGRESPDLTEVASQGPTLVARGLMAMGIALLTGALVGRTMPAFLVAAIAVLAWSVIAVPTVQRTMFDERAVWRSQEDSGWREGAGPIAWVDSGDFDTSKPGVDGEPGARFDYDQYNRQQVEKCGQPPDDDTGESPESQAWWACAEAVPVPANMYWNKVVPASTYPDFQLAELGVDALIGGAAMLLTFPVVTRRRPS